LGCWGDRLKETINAERAVAQYGYDANNNLPSTENLFSGSDPLNYATTHIYDRLNRQASIADALGPTTIFEYDSNASI
jgi:hypothetical protein